MSGSATPNTRAAGALRRGLPPAKRSRAELGGALPRTDLADVPPVASLLSDIRQLPGRFGTIFRTIGRAVTDSIVADYTSNKIEVAPVSWTIQGLVDYR